MGYCPAIFTKRIFSLTASYIWSRWRKLDNLFYYIYIAGEYDNDSFVLFLILVLLFYL